jgi:hypothetical protein
MTIEPVLTEPTSLEPFGDEGIEPLIGETISLESSFQPGQFEPIAPATDLLTSSVIDNVPAPSSPGVSSPTPTIIEPIEPSNVLAGFETTNIVSSDDPLGL